MELSRTIETETGEMIVKRVSVPLGLEELMEGLAKEVILKKPKDIYIFAADYFSRLLRLRDSGLYRGNVRSAKLAVKRPFRATVVGHNVLSNSESTDSERTKGRKTPFPQRSDKNSSNILENRRAMIQNHLRKRQETETQHNQRTTQNTKSATTRSKLPTRSRSLSKSSSDKSQDKLRGGEVDKNGARRTTSGKENIQQKPKISPRSRSTSISSSSSIRELKEKKRMEAIKEKKASICGTDTLNKMNGEKISSENVGLEDRNIQRSISVTQDKNGHYEVLYRPTPLPTGQIESTNASSEQSNDETTSDAKQSTISDQNDGQIEQSEGVYANDEVKSATAIQALWRGRQDRKKLKERLVTDAENIIIPINERLGGKEPCGDSEHLENNSQGGPTSSEKNEDEETENIPNNNSNIGISSSANTEGKEEASDTQQQKDIEDKVSPRDDKAISQDQQTETEEKLNEEPDGMKGEKDENEKSEDNKNDDMNGTDEKKKHSVDTNDSQAIEGHQETEETKIKDGNNKGNNEEEGVKDIMEKRYHRSDTIEVSSDVTPKEIDVSDRDTLHDVNSSAFHEEDTTNLSGGSSLNSKASLEEENAKPSVDDNLNTKMTTPEETEEPKETLKQTGSQETTDNGGNPKVSHMNEENEDLDGSMNTHPSKDRNEDNIKDTRRVPSPTEGSKQIDDSIELQLKDTDGTQSTDAALEIPPKSGEDTKRIEFTKERSKSHKLPKSDGAEENDYGTLRKVHSQDYEKTEIRRKRSVPKALGTDKISCEIEKNELINSDQSELKSDTNNDNTSRGREETQGHQMKKETSIEVDEGNKHDKDINEANNQDNNSQIKDGIIDYVESIESNEANSSIAGPKKDDNHKNIESSEKENGTNQSDIEVDNDKAPTEQNKPHEFQTEKGESNETNQEDTSEDDEKAKTPNASSENQEDNSQTKDEIVNKVGSIENVDKESQQIEDDSIVEAVKKDDETRNIPSEINSVEKHNEKRRNSTTKPNILVENSKSNTVEPSDELISDPEGVPISSDLVDDKATISNDNTTKESEHKEPRDPEKDALQESNGINIEKSNENKVENVKTIEKDEKIEKIQSEYPPQENSEHNVDQTFGNDESMTAQENSKTTSNNSDLIESSGNDSKSSEESMTVKENLTKSNISNLGSTPIPSDDVEEEATNLNADVEEKIEKKPSEISDENNLKDSNEENLEKLNENIDKKVEVIDESEINQGDSMKKSNTSDVGSFSNSSDQKDDKNGESEPKNTENSAMDSKVNDLTEMMKNENEEIINEPHKSEELTSLEHDEKEENKIDAPESINDKNKEERKNTEEIPDSLKMNLDTSESESAIRIQTIWRGFQARKNLKLLLEQRVKGNHSPLIKKLSTDSIKDENENLPETKNNNLSDADSKDVGRKSDELVKSGDENGIVVANENIENIEDTEAPELQNGGNNISSEVEAAVKIQSAFRKSRKQRINSDNSNLDVEGENNEEDKNKITEIQNEEMMNQSSESKELGEEDSYTNEEINAAVKIQSTFRKSRKLAKSEQENPEGKQKELETPEKSELRENSDSRNVDNFPPAPRIQSTVRQSRKQRSKPKLEDMDLSSDLGKQYLKEVLKIQSAWRAYKVRKNIRDVEKKINKMESLSGNHSKKSIHLTDQEILKAVTKIQAGLRGYLTRKHFNNIRERNEALDRIKEESNSEFSRTNSNTSTDEHLLEILKQVEGATVPDTVPEIPSDESPASVKHMEPLESSSKGILVSQSKSREDQKEKVMKSKISDGISPKHSSNDTEDSRDVENSQQPTQEPSQETTSQEGIKSEKGNDNRHGISEEMESNPEARFKYVSGIKDSSSTTELARVESTETKGLSEESGQLRMNESNTSGDGPVAVNDQKLAEGNNDMVDDISKDDQKSEKKETDAPSESESKFHPNSEPEDTKVDLMDPPEKISAIENDPGNTADSISSEDIPNGEDKTQPEISESNSTGSSRGTLKKTKAIDNLVELAEKFESEDEPSEDKDKDVVELKDLNSEIESKDKSNAGNIDHGKPGKKVVVFEIPDGFGPDAVEDGEIKNNLNIADEGIENRPASATNSLQSLQRRSEDELTPRSDEPSSPRKELEEKGEVESGASRDSNEEQYESSIQTDEQALITKGSPRDGKIDQTDNVNSCVDGSSGIPAESLNIKDEKSTKSDDSLNRQALKDEKPTLTDFMKKTLDLQTHTSPEKKSFETSHVVKEEVPKRSRYESAVKIQSMFRGYLARKFVEKLRASHVGKIENNRLSSEKTDVTSNSALTTHGSLGNQSHISHEDSKIQGTQTNDVGTEANGNVNVDGSQVPAGVENLTTETKQPIDVGGASGDVERPENDAQSSVGDANTQDTLSNKPGVESECEMESTKRNNSTLRNKNMEAEAATKIQAGFRGYKVRKQLKMKDTSSDEKTKKSVRRKCSSCLTENQAKRQKENIDLQEKSAVKIQAGIRGFLVRKRVKNPQKSQE